MSKRNQTQPPGKPISLRAFARAIAVNHSVVNKGVKAGRLGASLTYLPDGKPAIKDLALAIAEWEASKRPRADDDDEGDELIDDRGDAFPVYKVSRAKREYHLAEIAETEARRRTGGRWLPSSAFDELQRQYNDFFTFAVKFLRSRMPAAIMRRMDINSITHQIGETFSSGTYRHLAESLGRPAIEPGAVPRVAFRLLLDKVSRAVDDVCTELSEIKPGKEPTL
ncbi:MAG: hypothetical protein M3619_25575 [Myxococcota bacterium]|nr:hypothetical protein [Myxococcota bacterium]